MADVNALAQEYFDYLLIAWPTWGHLMGNYQHADLYDDASRAGEDDEIRRRREFADRAEAIPAADLSAQDRITREMLVFDGRRNAEILEARFAEFGVDPIFGPVAGLPVYMPKLPIPDADVAEAMIGKTRRIATNFRDMSDRLLDGVARGRTPAASISARIRSASGQFRAPRAAARSWASESTSSGIRVRGTAEG